MQGPLSLHWYWGRDLFANLEEMFAVSSRISTQLDVRVIVRVLGLCERVSVVMARVRVESWQMHCVCESSHKCTAQNVQPNTVETAKA